MGDIRITPIETEYFYHIYNRGVNGEVIFKNEDNYYYFLGKVKKYLLSVCDIYAYCLLPNHFHFLVKIKEEWELKNLVKILNLDKVEQNEKGLHSPQNIFSKQFSKIFNSYSQAFNKQNNRHGPLIESPFKRKLIHSEDYLIKTLIYIHQNPQNHSIIDDYKNYKFSSYQSIISNSKTSIKRDEVLDIFDNLENFKSCHQKIIDFEDFD